VIGAVSMLVGAELRRRWRSLVVITLLIGLAGGVTLGAIAGARRTATSFDRFIDSTNNHDVLVFADDVRPPDVARLRTLQGVAGVGYARQLAVVRPDGSFLAVGGPLDAGLFRDVDRPRLVAGRLPARDATDEVVLPEPLARSARLGVGGSLKLRSYTPNQIAALATSTEQTPAPAGPTLSLRIVGISRSPLDLSLQGGEGGVLYLPRAFVERYGAVIGNFSGAHGGVLLVRLTNGEAGVPRFLRQLRAVLGSRHFDVDPAALSIGGVQHSIDLLTIGLLVFGVIAGVASVIALTLVISRQIALLATGQAPVRDLGLPRRPRAAAIVTPALLAIGAGAVIAALVAWAASPLTPFGVAGRAEPDPGLRFDASTLALGVIAIVLVLGGVATVVAWRGARMDLTAAKVRGRRLWLGKLLENGGAPPPATVGVRMALEAGRGRTAVPVRSALVGVAVAVLGVTAVAIFAGSLDHLGHTPRAYGVGWDVRITDTRAKTRGGGICGPTETRLTNDVAIESIANACSLDLAIDGRAVGAVGLTSLRGALQPTVLEGRAPENPGEVALGTETMNELGLKLDDRVKARGATTALTYRVVGRVVVPSIGEAQAIADGAVFTGQGLARIEASESVSSDRTLVARFRPGVDQAAATRRIARMPGVGDLGAPGVQRIATPLDVERFEQTNRMPFALALFLALLGVVAVGHLLVTSVQRRRRDFAILKSMGFRRVQVYATVASQATTVALIGVVIGVAAGVIAGSVLWRAAADNVGVVPDVDFAVLTIAGIAFATVAIANVVAAFPGHTAARTRPAVTLREE
jgi:FtsX-like permease family